MNGPFVRVAGLSKKYCADLHRSLRYGAADLVRELSLRPPITGLRPSEFWAVQGVDFELGPHDALGVIGRNGAGKSTLLRMLAGITRPDAGEVRLRGRVGALLSLGAGFNSTLTGRENILVEGAALGMSRAQTLEALDEIIDFSELGGFIDAPVHTYSSGMRMRLGFAVATCLEADILLLDEVLIVGDINFRKKSVEHVKRFTERGGTLVFSSHEMWLIQAMCTQAIHLRAGTVVAEGGVTETVNNYYEELLAAEAASAEAADASSPTPMGGAAGGTPGAPAPVVIHEVTITGPDGPVRSGRDVELSVQLDVRVDEFACWWGFRFWTPDRIACITAQGTLELPPVRLTRGHHLLRATVERLPLLSGTFLISAIIIDAVTTMPVAIHGQADRGTQFTVDSDASPMANMQRMAAALMDMDVRWHEAKAIEAPTAASTVDGTPRGWSPPPG